MIKLIGILIITLGFMLKLDTIAIVIFAGVATGLVSGLEFTEILSILGKSFYDTRYMSIFLITLPVIGLLERNGLKNTATNLIMKMQKATVNNILNIYTYARLIMSMVGIRLGGHVQFVRPILYPMVESIAKKDYKLNDKKIDLLKGISCSVDNYANFFGQNVFIANPGVLLIVGTLQELGISITPVAIGQSSFIIACVVFVLVPVQTLVIKKYLQRNK